MRRHALAILLACLPAAAAASPPPLEFAGTTWYARWWDGGLVEYTPDGQTDLERYSEMLSLLPTPAGLQAAHLDAYTREMAITHERRGGRVLSRECQPAAPSHLAECTLLIGFGDASHVELAVVRHIALRAGIAGFSLSHREYGDGAEDRAKTWIASPAGQRLVGGFLDWVDATGLRMDAVLPPRDSSAGEQPRDVGGIE